MTKTAFMLPPRDNPDPTACFDEGCSKSRVEELTGLIIAKLVHEDLQNFAMEYKRAFQPVPPYPFTEQENRERFQRRAREEAERILKQERKSVVEHRTEYIRNVLIRTIKALRFLVSTEHGKGKIYIERMVLPDHNGHYVERDISYFESYPEGIEKVHQISNLQTKFSRFNDYAPFMDDELRALLFEAQDLANLEVVRVEDEKKEKQKTSGAKSVGDQAKKEK